ncbi:MAG TPA: hypothetical protein VEJ63_05705 [Planctomycetota bacterium]|nr:hypothetical protein [Planctomycetota bacterium]
MDNTPKPPEIKTYPFHPVANRFPMIEGDQFKAFCEDMRANGQREPILVWRAQIIDGRNRLAACETLGIEPWYDIKDDDYFENEERAIAYIISINIRRRHLTQGQLAALAAECAESFASAAKARQQATLKQNGTVSANLREREKPQLSANLREAEKGKATEKAAEAFGVSSRSVESAKKVKEKSPHLHAKVKAGKISVHAAVKEIEKTEKQKAEHAAAVDTYPADVQFKLKSSKYNPLIIRAKSIKEDGAALLKLAEGEMGAFIDINRLAASLEIVEAIVKAGRPHSACPYCRADRLDKKGCKACKSTGWVPKLIFDQAPPELKKGGAK